VKPQLLIVAGPNGAGKSTLGDRHLFGRLPVVNSDNIEREHSGIGRIQAGKLAIRSQNKHLADGESFAWETTLSGNRELPFMRKAKAAGYKINLVFVGVRDARASMLRVSERVAAGGHHIPPADVARRLERSLHNLPEAIAIADRAFAFDNSVKRRRLLISREREQLKHVSKNLPRWFVNSVPNEMIRARGIVR
jgi:predicted ABC-type ATPase